MTVGVSLNSAHGMFPRQLLVQIIIVDIIVQIFWGKILSGFRTAAVLHDKPKKNGFHTTENISILGLYILTNTF